jgi:hypothetical protein
MALTEIVSTLSVLKQITGVIVLNMVLILKAQLQPFLITIGTPHPPNRVDTISQSVRK